MMFALDPLFREYDEYFVFLPYLWKFEYVSYLFFEVRALIRRHSIRLGNNRYDVDFVVKTLHKLHIEWLQSVAGGRDEIEAAVHPTIRDLSSRHAGLRVEKFFVLRFDVVDYRYPTGK